MQGDKTTEESVPNERKREKQDEVHNHGTSVIENKETAEQAKDDEQSTATEKGKARFSERIEPEDEHSKGDMKYQHDKLHNEGQKQVYAGKRKANGAGNEGKHKVKNESDRSDGTENGNTANQEKQGAVEENHATDKRKGEDVERFQAKGETKSDEAGNKKKTRKTRKKFKCQKKKYTFTRLPYPR